MNKDIERKIGKNIRRLRKQAGFTQELLAAKLQLGGCDITRSIIANIESGLRYIYPDEIILLKQILNVEYEDIFHIE